MRLAGNAGDALEWDVHEFRFPGQAAGFIHEVASRLPFFVPRAGLLLLDWQAVGTGGSWRVQPRLDLHCEPWVALPPGAVRPTGAVIHLEQHSDHDERFLTLQMPARRGRRGARVPLANGLMRLSIQAHDEHVRFLPVVLRSDLVEDRWGYLSLHLHSLDLGVLVSRGIPESARRKQVVASIAERVLGLMALPGAGLAREAPMLINNDGY
ncbi:MAG: hypothetical protein ACOY3X_11215 [Pseudomonadota bacterium]